VLLGIRWGSLRAKIIAWSFVPTAIILVAVALVTLYTYQQVTENLVVERDQQLIRLAAGQLTTELTEHTGILADLARSVSVHHNDPVAQQAALKQAGNRLVVFDGGVLILDNRGQVLAAGPGRPEVLGQDWSDRSYFRQMLRTSEAALSDIVADGPQGAEVIAVAVPVTGDQGEFLGTVLGMFRLGEGALSVFYSDIVKLRIGESGATYLVDGSGRVIYHSNLDRVGDDFSRQTVVRQALAGEVGAVRTHDLEGREIVAGFAPVPGTSWGLVAEENWSSLTSTSRGYRQFLLLLLALGVLLPALVMAVGVQRITQPILELIDAAQEVAAGHFGRRISASTGDEVEELAEQFNFMSAQLHTMVGALEQRVVDLERTKGALKASRDQLEAILGGVADGITAHRPTGEMVYANDEAARVVGYPSAEALVKAPAAEVLHKFEIMDEAGQPFPLEQLPSRLARQGVPGLATVLRWRVRGSGVERWLVVKATPILDQSGAVQLAISIFHDITELKQAEKTLRRYAQRLEVMQIIDRAILAAQSLEEIARATLDNIRQLVSYRRASVVTFDMEAQEATVIAVYGPGETSVDAGARPPLDAFGNLEGLWQGQVRVIEDVANLPQLSPMEHALRQEGVCSYIAVPLLAQGELIGALNLGAGRPEAFDENHIEIASEVADVLAVAIQQARLHEQVQRHAKELEQEVAARTRELAVRNRELLTLLSERWQAAKMLRRSEARLRFMIQQIPAILWTTDSELRFTSSTGAGLATLDLQPGDLVGMTLSEYFQTEDPESLPIAMHRRALRGESVTFEQGWAGNVYQAHVEPLRDAESGIVGCIGVALDITERKQAEEVLRKLSQLEERQQIAAEMHDGLAQTLNYLGLKVETAVGSLATGRGDDVIDQLQHLRATIDQASQEVRQFIARPQQGIRPPQALEDRLAEMTVEFRVESGPAVDLLIRSQSPLPLPHDQTEQVVRVVREALLNASRHARAERIVVCLELQGGQAVVSVEDDGGGFDPQASSDDENGHFGLDIMRARAARLGGELSIDSTPGQGTRVVLRWPIEQGSERSE